MQNVITSVTSLDEGGDIPETEELDHEKYRPSNEVEVEESQNRSNRYAYGVMQMQEQDVHALSTVSVLALAERKLIRKTFLGILGIVTLCGVLCTILVWALVVKSHSNKITSGVSDINAFSWNRNANLHMLLMVAFFVIFHGYAIIIYRILPDCSGYTVSLVHAGLFWIVFIGVVVGSLSIWAHAAQIPPRPPPAGHYVHLYSIHSWVGLLGIIIFCLHFAGGFFVFLLGLAPRNIQICYLIPHKFAGSISFILSSVSAAMGLMMKQNRTDPYEDSQIILKIISLSLSLFITGVIIILIVPFFQRPIAPMNDPRNSSF